MYILSYKWMLIVGCWHHGLDLCGGPSRVRNSSVGVVADRLSALRDFGVFNVFDPLFWSFIYQSICPCFLDAASMCTFVLSLLFCFGDLDFFLCLSFEGSGFSCNIDCEGISASESD